MRIHFINRYFFPDHSATSQILSDLCSELARDGTDEICVVTSRQRYNDAAAQLPAFETIDGVQERRMRTTTFGRAWLPGRAIDYPMRAHSPKNPNVFAVAMELRVTGHECRVLDERLGE